MQEIASLRNYEKATIQSNARVSDSLCNKQAFLLSQLYDSLSFKRTILMSEIYISPLRAVLTP